VPTGGVNEINGMDKSQVSYVLTGNLLTGKLPATNITGNLRTLVITANRCL